MDKNNNQDVEEYIEDYEDYTDEYKEDEIEEDNEQEFDYDLSIENLQNYFRLIENNFVNYEERKSQKRMIMTILKAYQNGKHAMIEAPTGTGKSMAYLLAFLSLWEQFDKKHKPKLVISTKTITLQEQLIEKDVPYFKDILNLNFTASLVKGRNNYICMRKFNKFTSNDSGFAGLFDTKEESVEFFMLLQTITDKDGELAIGDKSEIKNNISPSLWNKIACESDTCLKKNCKYYNECFFYRARNKQKAADILVVNHALFFADLNVRMETNFTVDDLVLPQYDYIVFDEAHHIEDVASDFLGTTLSRYRFKRLFSDVKKAITTELGEYFGENTELQQELLNRCTVVDILIDEIFQKVVELLDNQSVKRLIKKDKNFVSLSVVESNMTNISKLLKSSTNIFDYTDEESVVIKSLLNRLEKVLNDAKMIIGQEKDNYAYWVECPNNKENRHYFASLNACPILISEILSENLFLRNRSIVLTSATMGTNNMSYLASRIGISSNDCICSMLQSPFDYEKQSRIYVPQKSVNPKSSDYESYLEKEILEIIKYTEGRALVLFTSYRLMNSLSEKFKPIIEGMGYTFLKQGDKPRTLLLDNFREDTNSVLFATSSYWEGIDVKGESLSCVIITKLPFEVPDRPIVEARMEDLTSKGLNPFSEYQVPVAIMKFKQGFGRLIRSSTDKGVVAVLDNRLITMNYGKQFIKSLPSVPLTRDINEIKNILL